MFRENILYKLESYTGTFVNTDRKLASCSISEAFADNTLAVFTSKLYQNGNYSNAESVFFIDGEFNISLVR